MKKLNYNDELEKILTAVFGVIGTAAIVINTNIKGWTTENMLDGIKDLAGLIVTIAVFLLANKLLQNKKPQNFSQLFEKYLKEWIEQNKFLIGDKLDEEGKGKNSKRYCTMMIDHSNVVTKRKFAKDAAPRTEAAAFVYLPYSDENGVIKNEFDFRFNEATFERQIIFRTDDGAVDLKSIIEQFSMRINESFDFSKIHAKANPSQKTITVSFEKMDQSDENAKKLIDMVEFVKTLVLAIA